jgi:hypothetical protein
MKNKEIADQCRGYEPCASCGKKDNPDWMLYIDLTGEYIG